MHPVALPAVAPVRLTHTLYLPALQPGAVGPAAQALVSDPDNDFSGVCMHSEGRLRARPADLAR
ncbi:MAG: hypothetical protein OHK0039_39520 [Bacteroidia bacterium]